MVIKNVESDRKNVVKVYWWLFWMLLLFMLDRSSKELVVQHLELYQSIEVLPFFNIFHVHNYGAAFSFLSDQPGWQRWFLSVVTIFVSLGILYWLYKLRPSQKLLIIALTLILSGALGNLFDRLLYGYVIDFIDWYIGDYHWPAFNVADACISVGAVLLIIDTFVNPENNEKADDENPAS